MATNNDAPVLTDGCWDCECDEHYIHPTIRDTECSKCGAKADDQPDSRVEEVLADESIRMTAKEAMEFVGMCPFCHHSDVDEDNDGECICLACGRSWKLERIIAGYSWTENGDYHEETEDHREEATRLVERVRILEEALERITEDYHDWRNFRDEDQLATLHESINKGVAVLETIKEEG